MKILFIVPNKKLIPSSIVRAMVWQKYLKETGILKKVINYESTLVIKLYDYLSRKNAPDVKNLADRLIFRLLKKIDRLHKNLLYSKLIKHAGKYDLFFFQWVTIPASLSKAILSKGVKIVYDYDDAVFLTRTEETDCMIKNANHVIAGSHFLFEHAKKINPSTTLLANAVDLENFKLLPKKKNKLCIGWIGSKSTAPYLNIVAPVLNNLWNKGHAFDLLIAGCAKKFKIDGLTPGIKVILIPIYKNHGIPKILSKIDIGIMPLHKSSWENGKSAMKVILYMAAAKPVVASNFGESIHLIKNNENGFLVQNNNEWEVALMKLLTDQDLREKIGKAGRKLIEEKHSLKEYFNKIKNTILDNLIV